MVVISTGYGGGDPSTTGPGASKLAEYFTNGRFDIEDCIILNGNNLIVRATADEILRVEQLLADIDQIEDTDNLEVSTFSLIPRQILFREDEETMNGMMTCVGIILPERIYEFAKEMRETPDLATGGTRFRDFTDWEIELIKLINSRPLAR